MMIRFIKRHKLFLIKSAIIFFGTLILAFIELSFLLDYESKYYQYVILGLILSCVPFLLACFALLTTRRNKMQRLIEESEKRYRTLSEKTTMGIVITIDDRIVFVNPRIAELTGFDESELKGIALDELLICKDTEQSFNNQFNRKQTHFECRLKNRNNDVIWCELIKNEIVYDNSEATMVNIIDITASKKRRERLEIIHRVSEALVNFMDEDEVYGVALSGCMDILNADYAFAYRFDESELHLTNSIGFSQDFIDSNSCLPIDSLMGQCCVSQKHILSGDFDFNDTDFLADCPPFASIIVLPVAFDSNIYGIIGFFAVGKNQFDEEDLIFLRSIADQIISSITRNRLYRQLQHQSTHDPLTGLYNRRFLDDTVIKELADVDHASVMMLDIDRFKEVNDRFGHLAGDGVLKRVANIISSSTGKDDFVFRFGGDEFLIIMPNVDPSVPDRIKVEINEKMRQWEQENIDFNVTVSIGKSMWRKDADISIEKAIQMADQEMYAEKREHNGS